MYDDLRLETRKCLLGDSDFGEPDIPGLGLATSISVAKTDVLRVFEESDMNDIHLSEYRI